jgi:hypothetical protein
MTVKSSSYAANAKRISALIVMMTLYLANDANWECAVTAMLCPAVKGAASRSVLSAKNSLPAKIARRRHALVAKVPSAPAPNARRFSTLVAESRSLILFEASDGKRRLHSNMLFRSVASMFCRGYVVFVLLLT